MKHLKLALLPLLLALASGCHRNDVGPALFATGVLAGAVIASSDDGDREGYQRRDDRQNVYQTIVVVAPRSEAAQMPAAPAPSPIPMAPPFDAVRTRTALSSVDLTKCRESGAPHGYGHAKVTLNPSGDISKVVVDEPTGMPAAAAKCIGDTIGQTTVPVFSGSFVTVGTTYFVP